MEGKCGDRMENFMALQKKMEKCFSQVDAIRTKVKALSAHWKERYKQWKTEQGKVAELEAHIKLLNTKQEEVMDPLQADMIRAVSQIQENERLADRLVAEISFLEERMRVVHREAIKSAAELDKRTHEARLALEATLWSAAGQRGSSVSNL